MTILLWDLQKSVCYKMRSVVKAALKPQVI